MANQNFNQGSGTARGRRTTPNIEAGEKNTPGSSPGTSRYTQKATEAASTLTSQVQGVLDEQVVKGARMMTNVANSVRRAAEELDSDAPQIAGLVRGAADRLEEYSHTLEDQSVSDIYQAASEFTRRQPVVVFGVAALAGFFALRTLKSSSRASMSQSAADRPGSSLHGEDFYGS